MPGSAKRSCSQGCLPQLSPPAVPTCATTLPRPAPAWWMTAPARLGFARLISTNCHSATETTDPLEKELFMKKAFALVSLAVLASAAYAHPESDHWFGSGETLAWYEHPCGFEAFVKYGNQ